MNYKNLKELDFQNNNITDITVFEKVKFELLENLDLSDNKISLIDGLDKANMKKLKVLDLSNNDISDVKQFGKISVKELITHEFIFEDNLTAVDLFRNKNEFCVKIAVKL